MRLYGGGGGDASSEVDGMMNDSSFWQRRRSRIRWAMVAAASLAVAIGVTVGGVYASRRGSNQSDNKQASEPHDSSSVAPTTLAVETLPPTSTPAPSLTTITPMPSQINERGNIISFIKEVSLVPVYYPPRSNPSPDDLALAWLVDEDMWWNLSSADQARQRFVMATIWFQHDVNYVEPVYTSFTPPRSWLDPQEHECDWVWSVQCGDTTMMIENLDLSYRYIGGGIPVNLALLSDSLTSIDMTSSKLKGALPTEIGKLSRLERLIIGNSLGDKIRSTIPTELCQLINLTVFNIQRNSFTGTIPECMGKNLSSLVYFDATSNALSGTLPQSLAELSQLRILDLAKNRLNGIIPTEWAIGMPALEELRLCCNDLSGSLPNDIGLWTGMTWFSVDYNWGMNGTIPQGVRNWTSIDYAYFHSTNLNGTMPMCERNEDGSLSRDKFVDGYVMEALTAHCAQVECPCCTSCCPDGRQCHA